MNAFLAAGVALSYFAEPAPIEGAPEPKAEPYRRVPWYCVMEWRKPS